MANRSVRGVEEQALRRLERTAKRRGISLNRLITEMLTAGGLGPAKPVLAEHDDLDHLAGTWTAQDAKAFERATAPFEQIDEALWR